MDLKWNKGNLVYHQLHYATYNFIRFTFSTRQTMNILLSKMMIQHPCTVLLTFQSVGVIMMSNYGQDYLIKIHAVE